MFDIHAAKAPELGQRCFFHIGTQRFARDGRERLAAWAFDLDLKIGEGSHDDDDDAWCVRTVGDSKLERAKSSGNKVLDDTTLLSKKPFLSFLYVVHASSARLQINTGTYPPASPLDPMDTFL